jgi:hypothetical protein
MVSETAKTYNAHLNLDIHKIRNSGKIFRNGIFIKKLIYASDTSIWKIRNLAKPVI